MHTFIRCLRDNQPLWRYWIAPVALIVLAVPLVLGMPLLEKQLIDGVLLTRQIDGLIPTVALYSLLWVLVNITQIFGGMLRTYLGEQAQLHLRRGLFEHSEALSLAFSHRVHSGQTMSLFLNDAPNIAGFVSQTTVTTIGSLVVLLAGAYVMLNLSWQLAIGVVVAPPLAAALAGVLTRPMRKAARRAQDKAAELNEQIQENLAGMREVVAFGQEHAQVWRFVVTMRELLRLRMRLVFMDSTVRAGQSVFNLAVTLVLFGFGGYLVITGQTTVGTLIAMQGLFAQVYQPAVSLVGLVTNLQRVMASADRIYEFMDQAPQVQDSPHARDPQRVRGAVAFDRVNFAYEPGRPVLHNITFGVDAGQVVALVGPSGAGKSTVASLIARFYDPTEGRVLVDGVDVRELTLAGLRKHIGVVFQDTFLFASTIGDNIAFGREDATEEEIVAAARDANAWEFIERLPKGLETQVGERGVQLSEGQKQRLAIARALLRDPRILILDEPTSALDARSEHLLQVALDRLMRGRTTFVIAHRLATVQRADRILVVETGQVVEQGTHTELLIAGGLYRELFELQFGATPSIEDGLMQPHRRTAVDALAVA